MTEIRVEDGNGNSLRFLDVDGFLYPPFPEECIRDLPSLEIRPDDIIVCAYPKSGTHWVWELLRQLLVVDESEGVRQGHGPVPVKEKDDGMLEMTSQQQLVMQPSPRVLNTHVYFQQLPSQVVTKGCRLVTVVRDPRDVAVSYYNHHRKLTDLYDYHGEWNHYLPLFLEGKLDYGSWFDYHESWEQGLQQHPDLPVLTLCYETIQQDSLGAVKQLAQFVGVKCREDSLRAVDLACCFDNMKVTKGHMETDSAGQPIMYRKGKVGDWKNVFTVAQAELFNSVYNSNIRGLLAIAGKAKTSSIPLAATYRMQIMNAGSSV